MDESDRSTIELTDRQIKLLGWIKVGCPDGVYTEDNFAHRVSARALASRDLIEISGRGDLWVAKVTPRGAVWPTATPEDAVVRTRRAKVAAVELKVAIESASKPAPARKIAVEGMRRPVVVKALSPSVKRQRLVDDWTKRLVLAGEPITVLGDDWEHSEIDWIRNAAERSPDRPHGQVLSITHVGSWSDKNYEMTFEPYFRDLIEEVPIVVPARVGKYHLAAREFLDATGWRPVGKEQLNRAARILHAIAAEGERRGLTVLSPSEAEKKSRRDGRRWRGRSQVYFDTEYGLYSFEIWESSGKLNTRQGDPPSSYQSPTFGDRKIVRLEDRLAEAFVRFEIWRLEWAHREEQRRIAEERKQRAWEAAMVKARVAYVAHEKWQHFSALSKRIEKIDRQRQLLERARGAAQQLPEGDRVAALEYLREMEALIGAHDPLTSPELITPVVKEPKDRELEPFLGGWSPYGADRR